MHAFTLFFPSGPGLMEGKQRPCKCTEPWLVVGAWFVDISSWSTCFGLRMDFPPPWERPGLWTPIDQPLAPMLPGRPVQIT